MGVLGGEIGRQCWRGGGVRGGGGGGCVFFFFFNDTATTEIYTLSLHDALPISLGEIMAACLRQHCYKATLSSLGTRFNAA